MKGRNSICIKLLIRPTNALECMNAILFNSTHINVSATQVAAIRLARTHPKKKKKAIKTKYTIKHNILMPHNMQIYVTKVLVSF